MVKRSRRRARGMTLIEVLVALLVTTVALLGALATVGVTVRGSSYSRSATEASTLAQSKLEQLVSLPTGTSTNLPASDTQGVVVDAYGNGNAPVRPYTVKTQWSLVNNQQRQVLVQVDWNDAQGKPHSIYASRTQDLQ
jgi:prepilin-type N-terminal cleavage/methylation domain-containing protein